MADIPKALPRIVVAAAYLIMVAVNGLANVIPINGLTTGQVSDAYPNLFAPAGYAFSIWGVIYVLLALFVLYYLGLLDRQEADSRPEWLPAVAFCFVISCLANGAWIFAWHYRSIPLSVVLIVAILSSLGAISVLIAPARWKPGQETYGQQGFQRAPLLVWLPFGVYFGWITVATIANITVLLVSLGWDGLGLPPAFWTNAVLIVGVLIAVNVILRQRDPAYGLAVLWAYGAILFKHISPAGFNGAYPMVIYAAALGAVLLLAAVIRACLPRKRGLYRQAGPG